MDLATIIDKAKRRGAVLAPPGRTVVQLRMDGTPSHRMSNAIAACRGKLEDLFLRRMELLSGGAGCLIVEFDLGDIPSDEERRISAYLSDERNLEYFRVRYGVAAMAVKHTPRYT